MTSALILDSWGGSRRGVGSLQGFACGIGVGRRSLWRLGREVGIVRVGRPRALGRGIRCPHALAERLRTHGAFAERAGDGYLVVEQTVENQGRIIPSALVEAGCVIGEGARVGGRAVLETGVMIGANTSVERSVVLRGAEIGENCTLRGCIVGGGVRIGDNTHVEGLSVLGEGVTIGSNNVIANGARIFPGVELPDGAILF